MPSKFLTYIIIVNWNGKEHLRKCLSSLFTKIVTSDFKIIVVDNNSSDNSVEIVKKDFPQVILIKNSVNQGYSKANNQGIQYALKKGAKNILLLNNDVEIKNNYWLDDLSSLLDSDNQIGIVGCKLLYPNGTIQHAGGVLKLGTHFHRGEYEVDKGQYDKVEFVDYVTGAALMIKSAVIHEVGMFDEGFTPLYYEDTDLCVRVRLLRYNILYTPKPVLIHHCGASSKKIGEQIKKLYSRRNFIRFLLLNYKIIDILKWIFLFESREVIRCLVVKSLHRKMPFILRLDASRQLFFLVQVWWPNIKDLKNIFFLRSQRFNFGNKPSKDIQVQKN